MLSGPDYRGPDKSCGILDTTYQRLDDAVCIEPGNGFICQLHGKVSLLYFIHTVLAGSPASR